MILAGSLGLGLWYRQQMYEREQVLGNLCRILELFAGEIRYGKATLPECCLRISRQLPEPYAESFLHIYEQVNENTGAAFQEILRNRLEDTLASLAVTESDKREFFSFLPRQAYADEKMQLAAMEQCRERIGGIRKALEEENRRKGKLAVGMGMLGGVFLVIVLL